MLNVLAFYYKKLKRQNNGDAISETKDNKSELFSVLKNTVIWTIIIILIIIIFGVIAIAFGGGYTKYDK
jgi:ABC-type sugar transport system permease subunit